ncbi:MAG: protein-glutamine gamma-glutamyltransferase [Actinomycetota bacterium]|jgi:transglutaminase-like putative cysteine protease
MTAPRPEDSVRLRVAVLVTVMASATSVLRVGAGTPALDVACFVGIPAAYVFSHLTRHRDDAWLKLAVAAGLLVAFGQFLHAVAGLGGETLGSVQVPLAGLFLWVQILHSLHLPARKDLLFSVASSVALIALAGVLSTSLDLVPHLVVWVVAFVASLVLAHASELGELPALQPLSGRDRRSVVRPVAGVAAALVVLATAVFVVVPGATASRRFAFPARLPDVLPVPGGGGALSNPSLGNGDPARPGQAGRGRSPFGYVGFADHLDLGVRGRPDDTLVMKVRASRPDFWRGQTFDRWDGRRWTQSDTTTQPVQGGRPLMLPSGGGLPGGDDLLQTFYVQRPGPNLIFGAYAPAELYFPDNIVFALSDGTVRAAVELGQGAVYTVVSRRVPATAQLLRATDGAPVPDALATRYAQAPVVTARVEQLARAVTANAPTTYDKVRALEAWMGAHTRYTLDVPPLAPSADAVDQFLFVDRLGFCEQIGTSLVVMLRSLGVPARLAAGYAPGERNPFTGMYEVRAKDAHAWAEVYFPGVGWQGFDPTAQVPLAGDGGGVAAGAGLWSYVTRRLPHPPVVPSVALAIVATGAFVMVGWTRRRRARSAMPWSRRYLEQLEAAGAARGRPRRPHETPAVYAAALASGVLPEPELAAAAELLDVEAYSDRPAPDEQRARADAALASAVTRWPN